LFRVAGTDCRSEDDFLKAISRETGPQLCGKDKNDLLNTFLDPNRKKSEQELAETIAQEIKGLLERKVLW
mgnify:CR=1